MRNAKVFLITGVSSGLGKAFAEGALAAGYRVVGTVRSTEAASSFSAHPTGRAHAIVLDVTDFDAIPVAVAKVEREIRPIDVLINNAAMVSKAFSRKRRSLTCSASSMSTCSALSQ
jgi:NADP-dependent 3-hydroxy acid dehydrogenase YdfG